MQCVSCFVPKLANVCSNKPLKDLPFPELARTQLIGQLRLDKPLSEFRSGLPLWGREFTQV